LALEPDSKRPAPFLFLLEKACALGQGSAMPSWICNDWICNDWICNEELFLQDSV